MLELLKIKRDINWLIEQVRCLMRKEDLESPLAATEWSPNHSVSLGNPYMLGCFVWLNGHVYQSLLDNNNYPPTNATYWTDLGEGHQLLEEPSDWNAATGRGVLLNKPTSTSEFENTGEDGSSAYATEDYVNNAIPPTQDLESVLNEGDTANDKSVNVESVGLWDNYNEPTETSGFARIYSDNLKIWFKNKSGSIIGFFALGLLSFRKGVYSYNLTVPTLSGNRTATFQDASGILAYTSDIPSIVGLTTQTYVDQQDALKVDKTLTISTTSPLQGGGNLSTNRTLTILQSNTAQSGFLSNTDWNTFNGKQNALTNPITGTGTINYLPKFSGTGSLSNSIIYDTGTRIGIGGAGVNIRFEVFSSQNYAGPTLGSKLVGTSSILSSNGLYGLYTGVSDTGSSWIQSQRNDTATAYNISLQPSGGNILINTLVDNGGKLQIKAGGALSTDIGLRVRNSADTADLFSVNGDGGIIIGGVTKINSSATVLTINRPDNAGAGFQFSNGVNTAYGEFRWKDGSGADLARVSGTGSFIIGGTTPNASSLLDVTSTTKGFLPPRMTTTQKNAIASPASGLVVYDTTLGKLCIRGAANWETITSI